MTGNEFWALLSESGIGGICPISLGSGWPTCCLILAATSSVVILCFRLAERYLKRDAAHDGYVGVDKSLLGKHRPRCQREGASRILSGMS